MIQINAKEAYMLLKIEEKTLYNWINEGKLQKYESDKGSILLDKKEVLRQRPTVITFFNQKGGVGKTSCSILLSDYYDAKDYKVLILDLDQQGNLSKTFFSYDELKNSLSLYDYLENRTPLLKIIKKYSENIDIIPASIKLSRKDNIDTSVLIEYKNDFASVFKKYELVIIDCPPAYNTFSRLGLLLSNYVFCPVLPEPYSYDGLRDAIYSINQMSRINEDYISYKVFVSSHKATRTILHENFIEKYKDQLKDKLFHNSVPEFIGIAERANISKNIFKVYSEHKAIEKIKLIMEEIENYIYDERDVK
ncbi:MAG: ParA family protein [Spirochaetes bacterium]|nr:ParA family protein [Spirochaetota bacterium]